MVLSRFLLLFGTPTRFSPFLKTMFCPVWQDPSRHHTGKAATTLSGIRRAQLGTARSGRDTPGTMPVMLATAAFAIWEP